MSNKSLMNEKVVSAGFFDLTEQFSEFCYKEILRIISFKEMFESKNNPIINRLYEIKNFLLNESHNIPSDTKEKIISELNRMVHIKDCIWPKFDSFSKNVSVERWMDTIDEKLIEVVSIENYEKANNIKLKLSIVSGEYSCNEHDLKKNMDLISGILSHVEYFSRENNVQKEDLEKIQNILNPKT